MDDQMVCSIVVVVSTCLTAHSKADVRTQSVEDNSSSQTSETEIN